MTIAMRQQEANEYGLTTSCYFTAFRLEECRFHNNAIARAKIPQRLYTIRIIRVIRDDPAIALLVFV